MRKYLLSAAVLSSMIFAATENAAHAQQANVDLKIFDTITGSTEAVTASWGTPLTGPITVTETSPDVWDIDLSGSGHNVLNANNFSFSWTSPEAGLFDNLTWDNDNEFTLVTDATVATGIATFASGVSIAASIDTASHDVVFPQVIDSVVAPVPEPASMTLLGAGLIGLGWFRRGRRRSR